MKEKATASISIFFRSDQLVCTEVIYRAFDGLEDIHSNSLNAQDVFSLSAEDILDMAMEDKGFEVVAAFGFEACEHQLSSDQKTIQLVRASY